jgi:outer membrane receptor protein involved in Fe transport
LLNEFRPLQPDSSHAVLPNGGPVVRLLAQGPEPDLTLLSIEDLMNIQTFAQDEIALFGNLLTVTLGTQVQYVADSGAGVQPTARVMWKPHPSHRLWASTSRAIRTPALLDRRLRLTFPPIPTDSGLPLVVSVTGSPGTESENLADAEAGYRVEIGTTAT